MKLFKSSMLTLLITSLVLVGCEDKTSTTDSDMMEGKTMVRVVHTSHDAPAVDILINDQVALSNIAYGKTSGYSEIGAGTINVKVVPAGENSPVVIEADLKLEEGKQYSVYAINELANISAVVSEDNRDPVSSKAKVRFLHSSPDAPAVDIKLNSGSGPAVFSNASFGEISDYVEVDQGSYTFVVTPAGSNTEVVVYEPINVTNGSVYTVIAKGTLDNMDDYDFATRVLVDNDMGDVYVDLVAKIPGKAKVRAIHTSYDAPAVDVLINDQSALSNIVYGETSGYAEIDAGTINVKVVPAGATSPVVIEADLTLEEDKEYSVYAVNELANISAVVSEDNRDPVSSKAKVRFLHSSPDAPAVDIKLNSGSGPAVFSNASFGEISDYVEVDQGTYTFVVTPTGSTSEVVVYEPIDVNNGSVYTVIAHGTLNDMDQYDFATRVFIDDNMGNMYADLMPAKSKVRVVHTSFDAPAVDILINDQVAISNIVYGETSGYAEIGAGTINVKVVPAGANSPVVIEADLTLEGNKQYSVFAVNDLANISAVVSQDNVESSMNKVKVRFLHSSPDAPAVDIKLNSGSGPAVFSNTSFGEISDYVEVDQGTYTFVVTPTGSTNEVVVFDPVNVSNGSVLTVVAHGTLDNMDQYDFATRVFVDNDMGDSFVDLVPSMTYVNVIHASPDAPGVDLLVDGIIANASALTFPNNTGYLGVVSGTRNIKVNASGTSTTVIEADLTLESNTNYSVFATDVLTNITPIVIEDDLTAPAAGKSHVRFLHLSPDAPGVDITLTDGTIVFGHYTFGKYSEFTPLDAGAYDLEVRLAGTDTVVLSLPAIHVADGRIYTIFAKGLVANLGAEIIANN